MTDNIELFGPNGEEVAALIKRVGNLTPDELMQLGILWDSRAHTEKYDVAYKTVNWRNDDISAAVYMAQCAAYQAVKHSPSVVGEGDNWDVTNMAGFASRAVEDAAMALVAKHLISQEYFNTLYDLWREVIERPETSS